MNYIEQLMKDNGIKVNEEFYILYEDGEKIGFPNAEIFYFNENTHLKRKCSAEIDCRDVFIRLISGVYKIEKIPQKPKTVWDLKNGDVYYYLDIYGDVIITSYDEHDLDKRKIKFGNAFLTKEEAKHEAERRKCEAILLKYGTRDMMSLGNINAHKYFIVYNNYRNGISISFNQCAQSQGTIYFETSELAQKAIEEVGEDRLKKYVFNVKE